MKSNIFSLTVIIVFMFFLSCGGGDTTNGPDVPDGNDVTEAVLQKGELPVPSEYDNTVLRDTTLEIRNGGEWFCVSKIVDRADAYDDFFVHHNPNLEILLPGIALQGNSISEKTPSRLFVRRGEGTIRSDGIVGADVTEKISEVDPGSIQDAMNNILDRIADTPVTANFSSSYSLVESEKELSIALKISFKILKFGVAAGFKFTSNNNYNRALVEFYQPYYTMIFDRPDFPPGDIRKFFHETVTGQDITNQSDGPPVYISSITYGQRFYLLIETTTEKKSFELAINAFKQELNVERVKDLKDLHIQVVALGGEATELVEAIYIDISKLSDIKNYLRKSINIKTAVPLSYLVRHVGSNDPVKNGVATEYTVENCLPNGALPGLVVGFRHTLNTGDNFAQNKYRNLPLLKVEGGDIGAPIKQGFTWWMFPDKPKLDTIKLPPGIVFAVRHSPNNAQRDDITFLGNHPVSGSQIIENGRFAKFHGGDRGAPLGQGFYWYESTGDANFDFTEGSSDWKVINDLPKYTVICLKHSLNQPDKAIIWNETRYDPSDSSTQDPPGFVRRVGGDIGVPAGEGYYWFEKKSGVNLFEN